MKFFNSKKLFAGLAIGFGVAAITSTALAAYIITGGSKTDNVEQSQTPIEITNNIVNLKATQDQNALLFQPVKAVTSGRLQSSGAGVMSLEIKLDITTSSKNLIGDVKATVEPKWKKETETQQTNFSKYIVAPTTGVTEADSFTLTSGKGDNSVYSSSMILTWTWGASFNNEDPCTYFNKIATSPENDKIMVNAMNEFKAATNALTSYTINLTMADSAQAQA